MNIDEFEDQDVITGLMELGLTSYQAKALIALVELNGQVNATEITKLSKVPRAKIYETLNALTNRDLIDKVDIPGSKPVYRAKTIEIIVSRLFTKYKSAKDRTNTMLESILGRFQIEEETQFLLGIVNGQANIIKQLQSSNPRKVYVSQHKNWTVVLQKANIQATPIEVRGNMPVLVVIDESQTFLVAEIGSGRLQGVIVNGHPLEIIIAAAEIQGKTVDVVLDTSNQLCSLFDGYDSEIEALLYYASDLHLTGGLTSRGGGFLFITSRRIFIASDNVNKVFIPFNSIKGVFQNASIVSIVYEKRNIATSIDITGISRPDLLCNFISHLKEV